MKLAEPIVGWKSEIAAIRRDIHAHPELAYEEVRTADLVASKLESWGIPVHRGLGITGVVGIITGQSPSDRAVGLRDDLTALPIQEDNNFDYASTYPRKMHACGPTPPPALILAATPPY